MDECPSDRLTQPERTRFRIHAERVGSRAIRIASDVDRAFALEAIAESVESGSSYELQVVPATSVYSPQRVAGLIDMTRIELSLPVAGG